MNRLPSRAGRLVLGLLLALASGLLPAAEPPAVIGLVTQRAATPFFARLEQGARQEAAKNGVKLVAADGDVAGQVAAMNRMVKDGVRAILVTAIDPAAIADAARKARELGVLVIELDGPTAAPNPPDALVSTDNYLAAALVGAYAKAALAGKTVRIATVDLFLGSRVGAQRHNGFLQGFGLASLPASSSELARPAEVRCSADSYGDQSKGETAMASCLQTEPDINLVYAVNESAAAGAYQALKAAGKDKDVMIVSVDGSCDGVRNIAAGRIAATALRNPARIGILGVDAAIAYARSGARPPAYTDTGATLITARPVDGVDSVDAKAGLAMCWE